MSDCHYGGVSHALDDPHGLLFCAEGDLDYALPRSPPLCRRFADRLHHLLTVQLTPSSSTPGFPPGIVQSRRACSHAQPGCPTRGAPPAEHRKAAQRTY